ncbi:MAG TPA: translation elongation factor-like protein [Dehalococcoidia bacterium]
MEEREVGRVTDYYKHVGVAGVALTGTLRQGDRIRIRGHTTDLEQPAGSLEIDHRPVAEAGPGQSVGIKVRERVRRGDHVYVVTE